MSASDWSLPLKSPAAFVRRHAGRLYRGFRREPGYQVAYDPDLLPLPDLMSSHDYPVLEEWFRWAEEWSVLLRVYAGLGKRSRVLDIGCGLGRIAFPLRFILEEGYYVGFDVERRYIEFLQTRFSPKYPNFEFVWSDVKNTYYNPDGAHLASEYRFPCGERDMDVVFAASIFTHMVPENVAHYFVEAGRVLRLGGKCLFSFFLLDHYRPGRPRPHMFAQPDFEFSHGYENYGEQFAVSHPENPELMTAYSTSLIQTLASAAGLQISGPILPGLWSGGVDNWIGVQDLVVLDKRS